MEKVFNLLETPKGMEMNLATHYLTGYADTWWLTHQDAIKVTTGRASPTTSRSHTIHTAIVGAKS